MYAKFKYVLKFIYSEKATKFCKISTLILSYVVPVKSKVEISQNFVAFSEYMNFKRIDCWWNLFGNLDEVSSIWPKILYVHTRWNLTI